MLLGTNLTYCISDILLKKVNFNDVYCIIAHDVNIKSIDAFTHWYDTQVDPMVINLSNGKNLFHLFDFEEVYHLCLTLYQDGVIVVRDTGNPINLLVRANQAARSHWYQINLREQDMEPAVKLAWDHYQMLAGLCK